MAARKIATPAVTSTEVTHLLATAKPSSCGAAHAVLVTKYGEAVADSYAASGCKRLPRHSVSAGKGHVVGAKPRGLMTAAERKHASLVTKGPKAPKAPSKVVTLGGTKFLVTLGRDGSAVLTKVVEAHPVVAPKVVELPMAESPRQVAAPAKVTRTSRTKSDPTASRAVSRADRQPKAAAAA
jgi:hypothetical protein